MDLVYTRWKHKNCSTWKNVYPQYCDIIELFDVTGICTVRVKWGFKHSSDTFNQITRHPLDDHYYNMKQVDINDSSWRI